MRRKSYPAFRKPFKAVPIKLGKRYRKMERWRSIRLFALVFLAVFSVGIAIPSGMTIWPLRGPLLSSAVAADLISCPNPIHHDGDAIRCQGQRGPSMRLYAIDAPEMPGACRPGRQCVSGDPYAARDHLASLTTGKNVTYRVVDRDPYGRLVVQAFADGKDVSCAMVRDGYAVERYGKLQC